MTPSRAWTASCGTGARIRLCFCLNRSSRVSDLFARPPFLSTVCSRYSEGRQLAQTINCVFQLGSVWDSQRYLVDRASRWAAVGSTGWDKSFGFRFAFSMMHLCLSNTLPILLSRPSTPIFQWLERAGRRCLDQPFKVVAFGLMAEFFLSVKNRSSTRPEN